MTLRTASAKMIALAMALSLLLTAASCANRAQTGAGTGALAGGLVGALVSKNKIAGAAIGAGIGLALGYIIGNEWDKHDQQQLNSTLEHNRTGQASSWTNPDTQAQYTATPQPSYTRNDQTCRDVQIEAWIDGKKEYTNATACRQPNGEWRLQQ